MKKYVIFDKHLEEQLKDKKFQKLYEREDKKLGEKIAKEYIKRLNEEKEFAKLSRKIKTTIDKYNDVLQKEKIDIKYIEKKEKILCRLELEMLNEFSTYKHFNTKNKKIKNKKDNIIINFIELCNDLNLEVNLKIKDSE